jgi:hypothetical protein
MTDIPEFEQWSNEIDEARGDIDPVVVNQKEKPEWEQWANDIDKQELQKNIVNNKSISAAETSWGKTIINGFNNFSTVDFLSEPIKALIGLTGLLANYEMTAKNLKDFGIDTLKIGIGRSMGYNEKQIRDINLSNRAIELKKQGFSDEQISRELNKVNTWLNIEDHLHRQYATEKGLKNYIENNPEDALMDLTTLLVPVLAGTRKVAQLYGFKKLTKGIQFAEKAASMGEPFNVAKQAVRQPIRLLMKIPKLRKLPENLYARAIRFHHTIPLEKQDKLIDIALKNETSVNVKQYLRLNEQIGSFTKSVDNMVSSVDPSKTFKVDAFFGSTWNRAIKDLLAISSKDVVKSFEDVKKIIIKNNKLLKRTELTPIEQQKMKKQLNIELEEAYQNAVNKLEQAPLQKNAVMVLNKQIRQNLEIIVPETSLVSFKKINNRIVQKVFPGAEKLNIKQINRLEGDLIELREAMSKSINEIRTGSMLDFQLVSKASLGGAAGYFLPTLIGGEGSAILGGIGTVLGVTFGVIDSNPMIKSRLAIYLKNLQSVGIKVKPTGTLVRLGVYKALSDRGGFYAD